MMATKPKGKTTKELRDSIARRKTLWDAAQAGDADALVTLGREWLGQTDGDEEDARDLGRKLADMGGI
jgi:hypothetical protein